MVVKKRSVLQENQQKFCYFMGFNKSGVENKKNKSLNDQDAD